MPYLEMITELWRSGHPNVSVDGNHAKKQIYAQQSETFPSKAVSQCWCVSDRDWVDSWKIHRGAPSRLDVRLGPVWPAGSKFPCNRTKLHPAEVKVTRTGCRTSNHT